MKWSFAVVLSVVVCLALALEYEPSQNDFTEFQAHVDNEMRKMELRYQSLVKELITEVNERKEKEEKILNAIDELMKIRQLDFEEISKLKKELDDEKHQFSEEIRLLHVKLRLANQPEKYEEKQTDMNDYITEKDDRNHDFIFDDPFAGTVNRRQVTSSNGTNVAFFARTSATNGTKPLQSGQTIVFDETIINIGNGYNHKQGIFMAPVSGVYVIYSALVSDTAHNHAKLMKNSKFLAKLHSQNAGGSMSNMVIVDLQAGDFVAVENVDHMDRIYFTNGYSTFSGFLLYRGYSAPLIIG